MKTSKLTNKVAEFCIKDYYENGTDYLMAGRILNQFADIEPTDIYSAIRMLEADGLAVITYADDNPYIVSITMSAIRASDEDTLIKKGYDFIKAISDLIP